MSVNIDILSGLGDKGPAAIVVEANGKRLLLDAGGALHPGDTITWANNLDVDAVLISHDHVDHIGGVAHLPDDVPLYCTPLVAQAQPPGRAWRPLPERGSLTVAGIGVTTGQAGHSLGGVWLHLAIDSGVFYSGDACFESRVFPFDTPPKAATALLDGSYGSYDAPQAACYQQLRQQLHRPLALPVPTTGRALELALWLSQLALQQGISLAIDPAIRSALANLLAQPTTLRRPGIDAAIARVLTGKNDPNATLQLISDRDDTPDQWPNHHLLHTGYLTPERCAQLATGKISAQRWNVHLRASHLVALADQLGASQTVPLFTQLNDNELNAWSRLLAKRLCTTRRFKADSRSTTLSSLRSFACPQ